jgi:hypothetical protein
MLQQPLQKKAPQLAGFRRPTMMSSHLGGEDAMGRQRDEFFMLTLFIQSSIFIVGFGLGYGLCAWRAHRRNTNRPYAAQNSRPVTSMFGHARRAF